MRILVTGGAGFIGGRLVDQLIGDGHEVLDNLTSGRLQNVECALDSGGMRFVKGDVRNPKIVEKSTRQVDSVIHLAAITSVPYSLANPVETHEVNATGTLNVLKAMVLNNVERLVFTSSCAVYGEPRQIPTSEEHPLQPLSPYAASKIAAEKYCHSLEGSRGLQIACLRLFNVYGPRKGHEDKPDVITQFIKRVQLNEPPIIYGDGGQSRDFIHVDDVVNIITWFLRERHETEETYNIGSGTSTTIDQLARSLLQIMGRNHLTPISGPSRSSEIKRSQANITRLMSHFGLGPRITLEEGLAQLV